MTVANPFDAVDLGALPPPDVIETLAYEAILDALKADFSARWPAFDAWVESDPALKLLEVAAYRELLWRQRVNDGARAVMLASAGGADLDHLAALMSVARRVLDPGDAQAAPPRAPVLEDDATLRRRVQLALEAATAAGTAGRYMFYALGADPRVADAAITSPQPGDVLATILSTDGDGTADAALLTAVEAVLKNPAIRQLNDSVFVAGAQILTVAVTATLTLAPGPGAEVAEAAARAGLDALLARTRRLGRSLPRSAIFAALTVPGVERVALAAPAADVEATATQAVSPGVVTITVETAP